MNASIGDQLSGQVIEDAEHGLVHRGRAASWQRHGDVASGGECDEPVVGPADIFQVRGLCGAVYGIIAGMSPVGVALQRLVPFDANDELQELGAAVRGRCFELAQ